ncbi:hypothetical protein VSR01_37490 [Actinacidiphila sp. DG2A-62]|uniref:hypothetical protein n=1 Tax=Actinacidiphila sp. DG2A-62 TaxID=3108821 RepID=UPI002DBDCEE0|nr:hypothetical protein [Actinacidiphila sp. DG2A-62]MEC3998877.1 hypothetical protein [Actinacidiphila sp. DG2A-62]
MRNPRPRRQRPPRWHCWPPVSPPLSRPPPQITTAPARAGTDHVALHAAVAQLPVAAEDRTGYNRATSFGGWVDADHDGCNTRKEVLIDEAVTAPAVTGTCTLTGGTWWSWYDDTEVDNASALDIDHLVPLAEAWDSK